MDVILDLEWPMTIGMTPKQTDLWRGTAAVCEGRVGKQSIWAVLYHQGDRLFADELFADLFAEVGRRSVPPRIVATVLVLQRLRGCSDREAVEAFSFDARWKYACGGLAFDYPGFSHTVLVDMRARLAASDRPERIFAVTVAAARQAGLVGVRRVLDSTPLYDAVATMDTVTLLGAAIRGLLRVADQALEGELRGVLAGGEEYAGLAKPQIDWDDQAARAALVDARARDGRAVLGVLQGRSLGAGVAEAARLLAAVVGQDLEQAGDGVFRIARKVAADRVISTVDPDARHGHKTSAHGFDGYKGHASVDPDSELVLATTATAGNVGDAVAAPELLAELIDQVDDPPAATAAAVAAGGPQAPTPTVYGDSAYGTGPLLASLHAARIDPQLKIQAPVAPGGHFTKDQFHIDLAAGTVTCPAQRTAPIVYNPNPRHRHHGQASFGSACGSCPLRGQCTSAKGGRTITITAYEHELAAARARQADPDRAADYRSTRPKVERKLAHLVRRRHGGRRVRVRGRAKVAADFNLLAAAVNLARLGVLGLHWTPSDGWAAA
ncbi:MAG: IS1182 family transposase [Sporichthyaceae bacterium]|nr:IS1182 family transposase [Sporichthyaceae bacterium]